MRLISLALVAFIVLHFAHAADIADGANKAEHAALCAFISMAGREIEVPTVPALDTESYNYVQNLNFALGDQQWQQKFYKKSDRKEVKDTAADAGIKGEGAAEMWADLKAAAEALKPDNEPKLLKELEAMKIPPKAKELARAELAALANSSRELKNTYPATDEKQAATSETEKQKLLTALLGAGNADVATAKGANTIGATTADTRQQTCTATKKATARPASALAMLACICQKTGMDDANFVCTQKAKDSDHWTGSQVPPDEGLRKLGRSCPKPPDKAVTRTELESALNNLLWLIHTDGTDGYLGAFVTTGCTGAKNTGICVRFPNMNSNDPNGPTANTWLKTVAEIIQNLKILEANQTKAEYVNKEIKAKKHQALAALMRSKAIAGAIQEADTRSDHKPKTDVNTQCETHNKSKTACLKAQCKWEGKNETDGTCKPKDGEGQTNTGAGEGTGREKTTEKCKGKPEKDCKSPDCKWEGETCKDSSFLLTNKFALSVVSAAFVALLF